MRVKLDENLPADALAVALEPGHDADTVNGEHLSGASDVDVLAAATENRFLLTLDRRFGDVRVHPPGTHPGIGVLRVDAQHAQTVTEAVRTFLSSDELGDVAGCIVVVRGHLVRAARSRPTAASRVARRRRAGLLPRTRRRVLGVVDPPLDVGRVGAQEVSPLRAS